MPADVELIAYNYYDVDARQFTGSSKMIWARFNDPVWRLSPLGIAQQAAKLDGGRWAIAGPMPPTTLLAALDYHVEIDAPTNTGKIIIEEKPFVGYTDEICDKYSVPVWKFTAIGLQQLEEETQ